MKASLFMKDIQYSVMINESPFCATHPDNSWTSDAHPPLPLKQECSFLNSCSDHYMNILLNSIRSIAAFVLLDNLSFEESLPKYIPPHMAYTSVLLSLMKYGKS